MNDNEILVSCKGPECESGIIYANYVPTIRFDSDSEYDAFMKQYYHDHALCPKCGASAHSSTYVAYILHMDKKDQYKDLNRCVCSECGDVHACHDRLSNRNHIND